MTRQALRWWERLKALICPRSPPATTTPDRAARTVENPVRVEGPLERIGQRWLLRIPLIVGGRELAQYTAGIGEVKGDILEVAIPAKLVENLGLREGQHLFVHNDGGRFTFEWERENGSADGD